YCRRWGEIERSGVRGQSGRHRRLGVDGRNPRRGRRLLTNERWRDGGANFRKRCARPLSRREWGSVHKSAGQAGRALPEFSIAGEEFCSVRGFSRPACAARRNRAQTGGVARKTAYVATGSKKRGLHFQESRLLPCRETG